MLISKSKCDTFYRIKKWEVKLSLNQTLGLNQAIPPEGPLDDKTSQHKGQNVTLGKHLQEDQLIHIKLHDPN